MQCRPWIISERCWGLAYDTIVDSLAWVNRVTDILEEDDVDGYDDDAESGVILELINLRTEQYQPAQPVQI